MRNACNFSRPRDSMSSGMQLTKIQDLAFRKNGAHRRRQDI